MGSFKMSRFKHPPYYVVLKQLIRDNPFAVKYEWIEVRAVERKRTLCLCCEKGRNMLYA